MHALWTSPFGHHCVVTNVVFSTVWVVSRQVHCVVKPKADRHIGLPSKDTFRLPVLSFVSRVPTPEVGLYTGVCYLVASCFSSASPDWKPLSVDCVGRCQVF